MPIFRIILHHIRQDAYQHLARSLCFSIFLGINGSGSDELNVIVFGKISHLIPSEHGSLVSCNEPRNSKSMNDMFLDELDLILLLCLLQGYYLHPFSEVATKMKLCPFDEAG